VHLFPGGPIRSLLGPRATPEQVAHYNQLYGFDQPFYVQYVKWLGQLVHGNLGFSAKLNQSVTSLIAQDLPKTIVLVVLGLVVSLLFGIPLGIYQAVKRYTTGDYVLTGISFLGSSVMDNLVQDYVRTARAKGASERRVLWVHIFRNSLISIVTLLGLSLPTLVAGAIFIEVVFNYPGMGLAFYNAALNVDYQVLLGFTLVATLATVVGNILADVGYAVLDPRVRYG
jgi:peptide/nickel transport system permease protein